MSEAGYKLLEHPADIGIRSWGPSFEAAFEQAGWGLIGLLDVRGHGSGKGREVRVSSEDRPGLLVDFLDELIFLHETEDAAVSAIRVLGITETTLEAEIEMVPPDRAPEGTDVKAATYHGLRVDRLPDGRVEAVVFLDV